MDNLECPVCLDQARDAVECTQCAQIFCDECTKTIKKCPMCRAVSSFKESHFARKLINNLPKKCDFCSFQTSAAEMKYHLPKCNERVIECNVCVFKGKKQEFLMHCMHGHNDILFQNFGDVDAPIPKTSVLWENKTKILKHSTEVLTTQTALQPFESFEVKIKVIKAKSAAYIVLGFSNKKLHVPKGFLGGDLGSGNWGMAGNGALGEEGKWSRGDTFKEGDTITLINRKGTVSYKINGRDNGYSYKFKSSGDLYLACSLYHAGDELQIVS